VLFVNVDVFLASHRRGDLPGPTALTVIRKSLGWLLMIVVATNLTYFLATFFLDPRANYLQLRPPRTPEQISRSLAQYNLSRDTPLLDRWWHWISGIVVPWDRGFSPVGESVNSQITG
jgi:glutathione transport system permease protein